LTPSVPQRFLPFLPVVLVSFERLPFRKNDNKRPCLLNPPNPLPILQLIFSEAEGCINVHMVIMSMSPTTRPSSFFPGSKMFFLQYINKLSCSSSLPVLLPPLFDVGDTAFSKAPLHDIFPPFPRSLPLFSFYPKSLDFFFRSGHRISLKRSFPSSGDGFPLSRGLPYDGDLDTASSSQRRIIAAAPFFPQTPLLRLEFPSRSGKTTQPQGRGEEPPPLSG